MNLIDNAIKYTPVEVTDDFQGAKLKKTEDRKGGVEVSVYTSAEHAHFEIVDHGIGISPEDLPFVFDRFYRADFARSRVAGGVGLGLAIVKSIVTAHDGTVSITSVARQGTTVHLRFPLLVVDPLENERQRQATAKSDVAANGMMVKK